MQTYVLPVFQPWCSYDGLNFFFFKFHPQLSYIKKNSCKTSITKYSAREILY